MAGNIWRSNNKNVNICFEYVHFFKIPDIFTENLYT